MARAAKAPPSKKSGVATRRQNRPTAAPAKTPAKPVKAPAAKPARPVASSAAPKLSTGEQRVRIEALEQANATLRAKIREANRAAKTAAARIAELEDQVVQLEQRLASLQPKPPSSAPARRKRRSREIDPGDAVPEGVAVQEPAPLDEEAEAALDNLTTHLGPNQPE